MRDAVALGTPVQEAVLEWAPPDCLWLLPDEAPKAVAAYQGLVISRAVFDSATRLGVDDPDDGAGVDSGCAEGSAAEKWLTEVGGTTWAGPLVHIPVAVITDPVVYDETLGAAGVHALASQLAVAKGVTVRVSNVDVMAFAVAYDASAERLGDALAPSSGLDAYWEFGCDALSDKLTCSERMLPQTLCSDVTVEPATPGKPAQTKAVCADAGVFVSTCTVEDCGGVEPATCDDTGVSEQLGHEFAEFDLLTNLQATLYPYASGAARADVPGVGG
jgi:hypothetical protein